MELAAAEWWYDQLHEDKPFHDGEFKRWSEKRTRKFPYHYRDGVDLFVSTTDLRPDDNFLEASVPTLMYPEPSPAVEGE